MAAAKPQLRGLLASQLKRDFTIAVGASVVATLAWRYLVQIPRRRRYEEFYKTYDPEADFERMKKAGIFQSVKPDGSVGEGW